MRKISLLFMLVLGSLLSQTFADVTYYVSPNGDDLNNGTSIATAYRTVAKAATKLVDATPTTIYLEQNATFDVIAPNSIIIGINKKVTIIGKNTTLKAGDKPYLGNRIITIGQNTDAKIVGVVFRNGCTRDGIPGGALFFEGNKLEIDSCTFINNEANNSGGAIASRGKDVILTNTVFDANRIFGGYASSAVIYQCGLPNGGLPGSLIIRSCAFTNNESKADARGDLIGFFHSYRGSLYPHLYTNVNYFELTNCLFKDNVAGISPSVRPAASDIYINGVREDFEMNLVNNTFYKTKAIAIPFFIGTPYRMVNNLFYNNQDFTIMSSNTSDERDPVVAYNNVFVGPLGVNVNDPALTTEKVKYGNQFIDELSQLGLTPRLETADSYVPYIPITSETSVLINKGLLSTVGLVGFNKELIPATDMRGVAVNGSAKDVGSFEFTLTTGLLNPTANTPKLFVVSCDGENAIVKNLSNKVLTLEIRLLDGRTVYSAKITNELSIKRSELEIPNGVLIFTANDGLASQSIKTILF